MEENILLSMMTMTKFKEFIKTVCTNNENFSEALSKYIKSKGLNKSEVLSYTANEINKDISEISSMSDITYLINLTNTFTMLKEHEGKSIDFYKIETSKIFSNVVNKLMIMQNEYVGISSIIEIHNKELNSKELLDKIFKIKQMLDLIEKKIDLIASFALELYEIDPDLLKTFKNININFKDMIVYFSKNNTIRKFIYLYVKCNKQNNFPIFKEHIGILFSHMADLLKTEKYQLLFNDLIGIAKIFVYEFRSILDSFYEITKDFMIQYKSQQGYDYNLLFFYENLFKLTLKEGKKIESFEIANLMLRIYDENLDNKEIGAAIIQYFFTTSFEWYLQLRSKSNLVDKYFKQLYKQKNKEIVSYFLEWLKQFAFDENLSSQIFNLNLEFELMIENFPYFNDNIPVLEFIVKQIKIIFKKQEFVKLFINQPQFFKIIKSIIDKKDPTSMIFIQFIEDIFQTNFDEDIIEKAVSVNFFFFETFVYHDEIRHQITRLSLSYEKNNTILESRVNEIIVGLYKILDKIGDNFADNCEELIEMIKILLNSISNENNNAIFKVSTNLFDNISQLIDKFTITLIESEKKMVYIFRLWNIIFDFICDYNKRLLRYKFQDKSLRNQIIPMDKSPKVISSQFIEKFIKDGLSKYDKEKQIIFLHYLYEKCIKFSLNVHDYDNITTDQDPLDSLKLKYSFFKEAKDNSENRNTIITYNYIILEFQLLFKCIINVIFSMENQEIKLSFITYIDYLCSIDRFNSTIILKTGILKILMELIDSSEELNAKIFPLLSKLMIYFDKSDLEFFFKQLYIYLIQKHNIVCTGKLLSIMEKSLISISQERNYVSLCKIPSNHPQTFQMLFLNNSLTSSFNIFISLRIKKFINLSKFTICKISYQDSSFSIEIDNKQLNIYNNKTLKKTLSFESQSKINKKNTWYNFIIEGGGDNYSLIIEKNNTFKITVTDSINSNFNENSKKSNENEIKSEQTLDFSIGYLNHFQCRKKENIDTYSVDVSYILLSKEKITSEIVQEIESNSINTSKYGSLMNTGKFPSNNITTEVIFSKIQLAKVHHSNEVAYKMNNQFDINLISSEINLIPTIPCNDNRKNDNKLYLIKSCNLLDYASMNTIINLKELDKSLIINNLFSSFASLEVTMNNVFFADMFYILLTQIESNFFNEIYQLIFNIILYDNRFKNLFINSYIHELMILFVHHSIVLKPDFSTLLTFHLTIPIEDCLRTDCIINIYLYPYLFTQLSLQVQKKILENIYFHLNKVEGFKSLDYFKIREILTKSLNLILFFELDQEIMVGLNKIINQIFELHINDNYAKLEETFKIAKYYLIIISNYLKYKEEPNISSNLDIFNSERIKIQTDLLEKFLSSFLTNKSISNNIIEDNGFSYTIKLFTIELDFFRRYLKYDKKNKHFRKTLRLIWPELFNDYREYSWFLTDKEGYSRMRKKLVLKESDMIIKETKNNKYDELSKKIEEYMKFWHLFEKMSLYDKFSLNSLMLVQYMVNPDDKYQNCYFCLITKNNESIESLLILGEKYIYIYYNVIIDKNKKIHLSKIKTSNIFWARNNNEMEWDKLITTKETKESTITEFNFQSAQIKLKCIQFTHISELHKRKHLHQNNSMELFTLKGSSYFITVFPKLRDEIFNNILNNINEQSKNSKIKNISKASSPNAIYLKHFPICIPNNKGKKSENIKEKTVIDGKLFALDMSEKWAQYHIPNFNYLMLINTISGRSYNDLSQYFIFPWMIKVYLFIYLILELLQI